MRTTTVVPGVALSLAVVGGAAVATNDASAPEQGTTLELYAEHTARRPPGSRQGEWYVQSWDLYELGRTRVAPPPGGHRIGRLVESCVTVTEQAVMCLGTFDLDERGTIAITLAVDSGAGYPGIAVTGGSGEFTGASGEVYEGHVPGIAYDRVFTIELMS